ncbi:MAG: GntR family transcriptional regulator [Alphaproteobacteria bacterium]
MSKAADKAHDSVRTAILSGEFAPGTHLKESLLVEFCGVSRTPVREALRRLHQEGLVRFEPHRGAHVPEWTASDLEEIFSLRAVLEGYAAEQAAMRITPEVIAELESLATDMEEIIAMHLPAFKQAVLEANQAFHEAIIDAAESPRLKRMLAHVTDPPLLRSTFDTYTGEDLDRSMRHHRELIAAFRARDGAGARAVMQGHVQSAYRAVMQRRGPGTTIFTFPARAAV